MFFGMGLGAVGRPPPDPEQPGDSVDPGTAGDASCTGGKVRTVEQAEYDR